MLYHQRPNNFPLDMQVSEGILEHDGKILLVQRAEHCSSPGTWSGPGGKLDPGEDFDTALVRELQEEIGVDISEYPKEILFHKYFYFLEKILKYAFIGFNLKQNLLSYSMMNIKIIFGCVQKKLSRGIIQKILI